MIKAILFKGNFVNGSFELPPAGSQPLVSEDPGDLDQPVGEIRFSKEVVDPAVTAARKAFDGWASRPQSARADYLNRFKRALKRREAELAALITREIGKPLSESRGEVDRILAKVDLAQKGEANLLKSAEHPIGKNTVARLRFRPRGVLAVCSPFNVPAYLASAQIIPALLHGNTVILKPSELTPFVGQFLAELWNEAKLPKGVFNLLQGAGEVGKELVGHYAVDGVLFTGSWETGSKIRNQLASEPHKICALEMGGKNAAIVLNDCAFGQAIDQTFLGAYMTSGQRCNATSRILVERGLAERFIGEFLKRVENVRIGYGLDEHVFLGPVVSHAGRERVLNYLKRAPLEGFKALKAGGAYPAPKKGYYLKPSVHLREGLPNFQVTAGSYTDEEVFGPDVAIYIVRDLDEAIELNNRSQYGLVTSVFTKSRTKFEKIYQKAESGLINWNVATTRSSGQLPFGGLKRSGNDRPAGFFTPYVCTIPTASVEQRR